ncbi:MAG TPA: fatty acid desaturase [Solirubrobacterales bacterium]|jgi:omega-6 fatty acid desaturase (delta-12 desaturase)|nr:fatty acid desaturase [Solirubrobacterales bacterium]
MSESPESTNRLYWRESVAGFERPSVPLALLDLATSVVPYVALTVAMYLCLDVSVWLTLALAIPAAGFLLRTFIVFHDCAHGSFLPSKQANLWIGRVTALLVFQPFANWRHNHAVHHGTSGDLDRRGTGDVPTLTVEEYESRSWQARLGYRLFRNPLVMFGIGPIWSLMIGPRIWSKNQRPRQRHSVWLANLALVLLIGAIVWVAGIDAWLLVQMPIAILAGTAGVFLFYVQHQFEDAYWESSSNWSYADAALQGSSYLKLPKLLQYFSGNIGLHHVHHLSAKVPNYNLQRAHDESPIFQDVPVLTLRDGFHSVRLKLIDPESGHLLTWREAAAKRRESAPRPATATPQPSQPVA